MPKITREARHYVVPTLVMAVFLLGPLLLNAVLPAASVGWSVLALLAMTALVLGWADGRTFRPSWSFPLIVGAAYFGGIALYFTEGTGIYLPVLMALAAIAGQLGSRRES